MTRDVKFRPIIPIQYSLPKDDPLDDPLEDNSLNQQFESDMDVQEKAELERLRTENASLLQRQVGAEKLKVQGEITAFCAAHPTVITPKIKDVIAAVLADLHGAQPHQFEADGKTVEKTSYEALKELLAGAKPQLVFGEVATKARAGETGIPGNDQSEKLREEISAITGD